MNTVSKRELYRAFTGAFSKSNSAFRKPLFVLKLNRRLCGLEGRLATSHDYASSVPWHGELIQKPQPRTALRSTVHQVNPSYQPIFADRIIILAPHRVGVALESGARLLSA